MASDLRLLNVKQPWAQALVRGLKDVENRSRHIPSTLKAPFWCAVVASKGHRRSDYAALKRTLARTHPERKWADEPLPRGAIVGLVRFDASREHSDSPWYNGAPDKAWVVGAAIEFDRPVVGVKGAQTPFVRVGADMHRGRARPLVDEISERVGDRDLDLK